MPAPELLICPSGKPFRKKYFASRFARRSITDSSRPASIQEGRIATVTNVERGMQWTRWRRKTGDAEADGEVVWA